MELERLEVILELNTQRIEDSMAKFMPKIQGMMERMERVTGRSTKQVEQDMDMSKATKTIEKSMGEAVNSFEKQMDRMEKVAKEKSTSTTRQMETGFKNTRTKAGKEIDLMVKDINAKLGQAKAAQGRIAELTARRTAATKEGDTGKVVNYDAQIAKATDQMTSYRSKAISMARAIKTEFDAVPSSLNRIAETMDLNEARIETMRTKIKNLQSQYDTQMRHTGNFQTGFKQEDTEESLGTMQKIQKEAAAMQKLVFSNDQLQNAYAATEDRAESLKRALDLLNNSLGKSTIQSGNASMGMKTVSQQSEQAKSVWSRFGGLFNRMSNNIAHGAKGMGGAMTTFFSMFNRSSNRLNKSTAASTNNLNKYVGGWRKTLWMLANQLIVFTMLYRGVMALGQGLWNSLKTNEEFASSLNQIKVNLLTAFYPIYEAVLPAINALMNGLAKVTGYLASFIATMFGTTYSAAKKGAQGLYENVKAMEETGSGADKAKDKVKELQNSLMGFDEINRIGLDVGKDDSASGGGEQGVDFGTPDVSTPEWLTNFADKSKEIFSKLFDPMKAAWDKHGKGVMDSFKYASTEIWELAKSIGNSFLTVWTDGTGERMLGNILQIITSIFNSVGNLASQFRIAWETNDVGVSIFSTMLGIVEDLTGHLRDMGKATEEWTRNLDFTPLLTSVDTLLKAIRPLTDNIGAGLAWFYENVLLPIGKWTIEDVLPAFLNILSGALEILNGVIESLKPTFQWLWDEFLKPIAEWTGGAIVGILEDLGDALSDIGDWISENQTTVSNFIVGIGVFAGTLAVISGLSTAVSVVNGIAAGLGAIGGLSGLLSGVGTAIGGIVTMLGGPWAIAIAAAITVGVLLWKNWDTIKEKAKQLGSWVSDKWTTLKENTATAWNNMKDTIKQKSDESRKRASENAEKLRSSISTAWDNTKRKTTEKWNEISNDVKNKSENARKWGADKITSLKNSVSTKWNELKSDTATKWGNIASDVNTKAVDAKNKAVNAFSNMKTGMGNHLTNIKNSTSEAFDKITGWASGLGGKIAQGLKGGLQSVKNAASSIANGLVGTIGKAVNGVINGINWVLGKVGASKSKIATWSVPTYAQGTGSHPGGPAIVNDGTGSNYQEAYELPNGQRGIFPQVRNMLVNLPKGSKVLNGQATAALYGNVPKYANGIGNWFSKVWDGAKSMAGTVWDYVSNPSKLLDIAISQFTNLTGALEPALSIAKGGISTIASGATSFIKKFLDKGSESPVGSGVERWRGTVIRALSMNGLPTTDAYVNAWLRQIQTESGGNERAVQSTAVKDINYYTGNLARGLVQVIPPTFSAYAFKGYNNPFNGLHSLLAGINYAKSRYGATGMLSAVGKGHGYENGGLVSNEGYYRLAEGNKKEIVIPLERKNRALELIDMAKSYLGVDDFSATLQMPESVIDKPTKFTQTSPSRDVGGGVNATMQQLMMLLGEINSNQQGNGEQEIVLKVDRTTLGTVVIKEINHRTKQGGFSPIIQ